MATALLYTDCPNLKLVTRGKVRDIYEVPGHDDRLLFVATDRISAFDIIMKNGIPDKGRLLTSLSLFFFKFLAHILPNHVITADLDSPEVPDVVREYRSQLEGRTILVKKCEVVKCEAIVRGTSPVRFRCTKFQGVLSADSETDGVIGSAWAEYQKSGTVHGIQLPEGLKESSKLSKPLFTPSTKADIGDHDENIHPDKLAEVLGSPELAASIASSSLTLYNRGAARASARSLILADTKFEFGLDHSTSPPALTLVDECLTPDSSRFWPREEWEEGKRMTGLDKQFLREWLKGDGSGFGEAGVELPEEVVKGTWSKYLEGYKMLTGEEFQV